MIVNDDRLDAWGKENGISEREMIKLEAIIERICEGETASSYVEGYDDGKASAMSEAEESAQVEIDETLDVIRQAIGLIHSDPAAARAYLDRAKNGLSLSLAKKDQPACLL